MDAKLNPCVAHEAKYVIAEIHESSGNDEFFTLRPVWSTIYKESYMALTRRKGGYLLYYADTSLVSIYTPKLMASIGGMLSGNFRSGLTHFNHRDFYQSAVEFQPDDLQVDEFDYIINNFEEAPVTRITQDHHLFVNTPELKEIFKTTKKIEKRFDLAHRLQLCHYIAKNSKKYDLFNKVSLATHYLYILTAPMFAVKHLAWIIFSSNNAAEYNELLKREGIAAKQLQTIFRDDLATIYEIQVLRNRSFDVVDWEKEKYNRTETNTVNVPSSKVFAIARQIFEEAKSLGCKPISMPWQDYWDARWVSMPGGSVVSQYDEDKTLKKALPRQARVKSAWFASNMHSDYAYWENRQQGIYASTSTKYEWGKVRALYGCDVTSFLHSDHSMKNCEDVMPNYFPVGSKANSKYVNQVIQYFSNGVPFCFDYDDFNSQHSTASMRSVLYAWQEVFSNSLTTTQQQSLQWTIDSLDDVKIEFNELGQQVSAEGTLLSGWRLTSFMNTVLNRVYLIMCDIKEHSIYALHNGDDMFATTTSVYEALQVVKKAKKLGVRAQLTKTNIGTIGEFLRVDTRATNPTGSQYLSRSIATAVHGRVETGAPNDFFELVSAHRTRANAIIDRGGKKPIVEVMLKRQLKFACKLFKQDPKIIGLWESLHPMQGGCNLEAGEKEKRIQRVFSTEKGSDYHRIFNAIKGVDDYVDMISRKFKLNPEKISKKRVREKAADMLMSRLTNYEIVIEDRPRISNYIGLYGAYKSSTFIVPLSKLRSVGMATVEQLMNLPSYISRMVAKSADPIMYMTAVF